MMTYVVRVQGVKVLQTTNSEEAWKKVHEAEGNGYQVVLLVNGVTTYTCEGDNTFSDG